jgi:hypothetical protein
LTRLRCEFNSVTMSFCNFCHRCINAACNWIFLLLLCCLLAILSTEALIMFWWCFFHCEMRGKHFL